MKKILLALTAAVIALTMVVSVGAATTVTFTDTANHWAWTGGYIPYLVEKEVLNGMGDGTFGPDNTVTRAQFIKMLDEAFGLTETTNISYTDVSTSDWFYVYVQKAAAQGYLLNYGSSLSPNGQLSREEAISLLVRYLDLPTDEKADSSTFTDYSSISANFREYVLQAIEAELINGYSESNGTYTFRPQNTLTRAEALTIIYRAAGCIYTADTTGVDSGAAATNAVIKKAGITVTGANLSGRIIISEGAASGKVTFSNCVITGTIYVRGTAELVFNNCTVDAIVVDSSATSTVSIASSNTTFKTVTLKTPTQISNPSGSTISNIVVNAGAEKSSVSGNGTVTKAQVNTTGFTCTTVPESYTFSTGITATFAGSTYSNTCFTTNPSVTVSSSKYYLNFKTSVAGTLYYYYTNSSTTPTTSSFNTAYTKSTYKGTISVKSGTAYNEYTYKASEVSDFTYVAVMFISSDNMSFEPQMVINADTTTSGFTTEPYFSADTTIKYTSTYTGTVYYYLTDDDKAPTSVEFLKEYADQNSELKGSSAASAGSSKSFTISSSKYLENYPYVVVMFVYGSDTYFAPVVITNSSTGFDTDPYESETGVISFKTSSEAGTVYYYYKSNADAVSSDDFIKAYNKKTIGSKYFDEMTVSKNKTYTISYDTTYAAKYSYMAIMFENNSDDAYTPVVIALNRGNGFSTVPYLSGSTIKMTPSYSGDVYYYLTDSATIPASDKFLAAYEDAEYGSRLDATKNSSLSISLKSSEIAEYPYVMIMLIDDDSTKYSPVCISTVGNGFSSEPTLSSTKVKFTTTYSGDVYYYFTDTATVPSSSDFMTLYKKAEDGSKASVTKKISTSVTISDYTNYKYMVLMLVDDDDCSYDPVIVQISSGTTSSAASGFTTAPYVSGTKVYFTAKYTGKVYYYYTDSSTAPTSSTYMNKWTAASNSSYESVTAGVKDYVAYNDSYDYVVFMLVADGTSYTPYVLSLSSSAVTTDEDGFDGSPTLSSDKTYISYMPLADGYVFSYYSNNSSETKATVSTGGTYVRASKGSTQFLPIDSTKSSYVHIMFMDDNLTKYAVISFAIDGSSGSDTTSGKNWCAASGCISDTLYVNSAYTGTVYYAFGNSSSVDAATIKSLSSGSAPVTAGQSTLLVSTANITSTYAYIAFEDASGTLYTSVEKVTIS